MAKGITAQGAQVLTRVNRGFRMSRRRRHKHKEVEKAVTYAESLGWRVVAGTGHAWGYLYCPHADRTGCKVGVWSTPKNPENQTDRLVSS